MRYQPETRHHRAAKGIPRRKGTYFQQHSQESCRKSYHRAAAKVPPSRLPSHSPSHRRTREPPRWPSRRGRRPVSRRGGRSWTRHCWRTRCGGLRSRRLGCAVGAVRALGSGALCCGSPASGALLAAASSVAAAVPGLYSCPWEHS